MKDTHLYEQLLGLEPPWNVSHVSIDTDLDEIHVMIDYRSNKAFCPECGKECSLYDHREERRWRHLDTCQMKTILICSVPRIECSEHGKLTISVPWSRSHSRFTLLFERMAIDLLSNFKKQSKVAQMLRISFDQLHRIMYMAVQRGLERRGEDEIIEHIGIDEKSYARRHQYSTVLVDLDRVRVVDLIKNRDERAARHLLKQSLTKHQRSNVKAICMDMWKAYISAAQKLLPQADIVHDHFHLLKYLNHSIDETRRQEMKKLEKEQRTQLKNSRYVFLSNPLHMSDKYKLKIIDLQFLNLETAKAWQIKENFKLVFKSDYINDAKYVLTSWIKEALRSNLKPVIKVAKMFLKHSHNILNYVKHRITNSLVEAMNSLIQEIKYVARGFLNYENFRISVLFYLGKLDLYP
jgi:transposase